MLKRLLQEIADYFAIGFNEARGVLLLILLTLLFLAAPLLYRRFWPDTIHDTTAADQRKLDSLVALMQKEGVLDEQRVREQYRRNYADPAGRSREAHLAEREQEIKLFPFNPNTVSVSGWQQLGLPRWLAERIDKYRSKGGQFRKKEDLLRIYDFPPDTYEQLEPYIQLPTRSANAFAAAAPGNVPSLAAPNSAGAAGSTNATNVPTRDRYAKPLLQPFDINTADTTQLIALKGIGSKLANRIIAYRDNLGGFLSVEQYHDIYGLDSINVAQLTHFAKVQSPVRKTPINTASAADLDRFPFISRRQAEVIVNYRNQHGAYASPESLKAVRILDHQTIEKLTPYLLF